MHLGVIPFVLPAVGFILFAVQKDHNERICGDYPIKTPRLYAPCSSPVKRILQVAQRQGRPNNPSVMKLVRGPKKSFLGFSLTIAHISLKSDSYITKTIIWGCHN